MDLLPDLTDQVLEDIRVASAGRRLRLLGAIKALLPLSAAAHPLVVALHAPRAAPRCLRDRFSSARRLPQALA